MKQKLFSIIVPTYNCGRKLAATLESVLSQPRELYEIIVVDGGSGGETLSVIEEYSGDLRFVSEPDRGVYDALNKGVGMSSGKHLLFLGAGDRLKEGVLRRVAEILPEGEPSFAYGDAYLVRHDVRQGGTFGKKDFIGRNLCHQAIFYERKIFDLLGGFDLRYKVYADWAFNMKCFAEPRVRKLYLGLLVADFEGWGISDVQEDPAFWKDLPALVRRHVGVDEYLRYRVYLARVSFYGFRHRLAGSVKAALPASLLRRQKR
ncbi:MAG TPA: glycosyltransferase family 2 protein [Pyrinomonadaceae bacterium]